MRYSPVALAAVLALTSIACRRHAFSPVSEITPKHCPSPGARTYLGFHGEGSPPPALERAVLDRFPDAVVIEQEDGKLGVVTAESYSMAARARHAAAGTAVGWKGDTVDFATVTAGCKVVFTEKFY